MIVDFWLRDPGNHHSIMRMRLDAIPQREDFVVINERSYVVHEVMWCLDGKQEPEIRVFVK